MLLSKRKSFSASVSSALPSPAPLPAVPCFSCSLACALPRPFALPVPFYNLRLQPARRTKGPCCAPASSFLPSCLFSLSQLTARLADARAAPRWLRLS